MLLPFAHVPHPAAPSSLPRPNPPDGADERQALSAVPGCEAGAVVREVDEDVRPAAVVANNARGLDLRLSTRHLDAQRNKTASCMLLVPVTGDILILAFLSSISPVAL